MEIIGYENYLIYEDGRVFGKKSKVFIKPRLDRGYKILNLRKNGGIKTHKVHRLVAEHYIPNPENKPCVDHINRITTDNRIENLRWVTLSENQQNRTKQINNKSGHKNIAYNKHANKWAFSKMINNKTTTKHFKSKIDCICYKFIFMLKIKTFENK